MSYQHTISLSRWKNLSPFFVRPHNPSDGARTYLRSQKQVLLVLSKTYFGSFKSIGHQKVPALWVFASPSGAAKEGNSLRERSTHSDAFPFKGMMSKFFTHMELRIRVYGLTDVEVGILF